MLKKIISLFTVAAAVLCGSLGVCAATKSSTAPNALLIANGIIDWKKSDVGAAAGGDLINSKFLEQAGTTPGDWYPIGLGRLGVRDNYAGYLAVIKDQIEQRYRQPGKLSAAKATEWHRIALAVLAMEGDPTNIGKDENGQSINLIADGTYDRGKTTPLGRQGINGWIWGLITLDSKRYEVPANAFDTRDKIIVEIVRQQLLDGGFALSGKTADADITAMAIQALAPYYNSEKSYTYTQRATKKQVTKTVRQTVDEALTCLSKQQLNTGDFASWGTENVESTDQVVVALCSLGIDPLTDTRFIKNGNTLLDGILKYRMPDGGFIHSYTYDPDNPTSLPNRSNTMASEQTLYTMAAIWRRQEGMRTLYDFRAEQSLLLKKQISELEAKIGQVNAFTKAGELKKLLTAYYALPKSEQCYVNNYWRLSNAAKKRGINVAEIARTTPVTQSPASAESNEVLLYFSNSDREAVDHLPEKLSTEQYVLVTSLLDKLNQSEYFTEKEKYFKKLTAAKAKIAAVQAEIDALNAEIKEKLYPFDKMNLKNKKTVDSIVKRYHALSAYDQQKIERFEDVMKTKTKIDNLLRGIIIAVVLCVIAAVTAVFWVRRVKARQTKKEREMQELAALYKGE